MERITVTANIGGHAGYHLLTNHVIIWMSRAGYYVNVRPSAFSEDFGSKVPQEVKSRFVQRVQPEPWELIIHPPDHTPTPGKRTCFFTMWESTRLRPEGKKALQQAEAIIVPSKWNASCFSAEGFDVPIYVVPLGIDPSIYNFSPMKTDGTCVFGAAGRLAHGGSRKGIYEVIDAFKAAFKSNEDVKLKVKCFTDCNVVIEKDPRIEIITSFLHDNGLASFLKSLTCFVTASRGEGWGLFQHQSMATGRPVIGCHYGGLAEFMNIHNSFPVEFTHEKATGHYEGCGTWAEPDMASLVDQMRNVYQNRDSALKKGIQAYLDVKDLTWANTAQKTINVLKKVGAIDN